MLIYADTASLAEIEELNEHPWVSGFTTNPTLFKGQGVRDPEQHAKEIIRLTDKPVSIDGPPEKVWGLGPNAIPKVVTLDGLPNRKELEESKRVNYTAFIRPNRYPTLASWDIISVFAGRIMDTGRDPQPAIDEAKKRGRLILWASTREVYNYVQAERAGCWAITMTPALIAKLPNLGKPLEVVQAETLEQFEQDRVAW